jgi:hypothetical protein
LSRSSCTARAPLTAMPPPSGHHSSASPGKGKGWGWGWGWGWGEG